MSVDCDDQGDGGTGRDSRWHLDIHLVQSGESGRQPSERRLRRVAADGHGGGIHRGRELLDAFISRGALAIQPHAAAAWPVSRSAREMIEPWRAKAGLAGIDVSPAEKEALLSELAVWAERLTGSLDIVETNEEKYMLAGVQLPARSLATGSP